jgi:uncharacterized protein
VAVNNSATDIISGYLQRCEQTVVAWLYGSRATGQARPDSDYDIAVALVETAVGNYELIDQVQCELACNILEPVSVVDVNQVPVPLAYNVITFGRVLVCKSDLRLRKEEQRIWSQWEEYEYEHERNRKSS